MAGRTRGFIHGFALVHLGAAGVEAPRIAHRVPDLLVGQAAAPRRHHALHVAVLRDIEQLLKRARSDLVVLSECRRGDAQPGGTGTIALPGDAVARDAVLRITCLALQRLGRCGWGLLGRGRRNGQDERGDKCAGDDDSDESHEAMDLSTRVVRPGKHRAEVIS